MVSRTNSFLAFKVTKIEFKWIADPNAILELLYTLSNSHTSQLIFQSPPFDLAQISVLNPVQLDADLVDSLTFSFYMQVLDEKKLFGSTLIDLSQNLPLKTWLTIPSNNDEILSVEIEIIKEENIENSFEIIQDSLGESEVNDKKSNLKKNNAENKNEHEMNALMRLYEIDDANKLTGKIEEVKEDIAFYHRKKLIEDEEAAINRLRGLERLQELHKEIKTAKEENEENRHNANTFDAENLEYELEQGLSKYHIENPEKLEEMIYDTKENISFCLKRKRLEEAKNEENTLADLENLNSIYKRIVLKSMIILDPKEVENIKQLDFLEGMLSDILSYPRCTERFLTSILCYAYYKSYDLSQKLDIHQKIGTIDPYDEFRNFLEFLNQSAQGNFPRKLIFSFKENFENKNWENLIKDTEKLLKEYIRPINIKELSRLISKSAQFSGNIENKDIILLIGVTGAGKSTTTHFLCGSKLDRILEDGVRHIKAVAIKNPTLKNISISSHAQSETRYITLVPINIKDSQETIFLCDTPGLLDTSGAEVDIANTISIVEYVKKCRSVRPLILLSSKTEGDRFEGVKKLAHTLARLVPNFNKYSNSFTYAFTKYKKKDASNIHALVNNAIRKIEIPDEAFLHILNDIKNKTKNGAITIDPLKDDPQELIRKILEREPIEDPKNAFESFITEDSRLSIKNQVLIYSKDIEKALNSMNYEIIKYKLDDLKYLASQFAQFEPQYISCVESVIKKTNDTYENTVAQFNSFLDKHGTLDEANIKAYKEIYNSLKTSEEIRESHLKGETVKSAAMVTNIISKLSLAHLNLKSENIDSYILKAQLNNAKLLSETFEDVTPNYEGICREYINLIESLLSSAEFFTKNDNFESFANTLLQAKKLLGIVLGHLNLDSLNEKYSIILNKFVSSLKQRCEKSIALLNKGYIAKNDIEILKKNITIIKSANDTHSLNFLISKLEIKEFLQSIIIVYQQYFDKAKDDVISFINNEETYNVAEIEPKFDEFSLLMEIPDIEYLISASYQES
ncbi:unnamed protein product [Blepharisma stoltei]|uniref:G domain-containing protein n=1 Tax=Blepharisma stoltei TaxID=1481888 RepID=A0AAU9IS88_9CILI|nr:unnamed protein product [Blepharisma stoltei]